MRNPFESFFPKKDTTKEDREQALRLEAEKQGIFQNTYESNGFKYAIDTRPLDNGSYEMRFGVLSQDGRIWEELYWDKQLNEDYNLNFGADDEPRKPEDAASLKQKVKRIHVSVFEALRTTRGNENEFNNVERQADRWLKE